MSSARTHHRFTEGFTNFSVTHKEMDGNHVMLATCMFLTWKRVKSMDLAEIHFECMFTGS